MCNGMVLGEDQAISLFHLLRSIRRMSGNRLSEHLSLEIEASRFGQPLSEGEPVLGCTCYRCILATFRLSDEARLAAEDLVRDLARLDPAIRRDAANAVVVSLLADGVRLPAAAILAELARRVDGARRPVPTRTDDPLPIAEARQADILTVCQRHGVKLRRVGRSHRGACPIHKGEGHNFSVDAELGLYNCFKCSAAGDTIALEQALAGVTFPDAVRRLAG